MIEASTGCGTQRPRNGGRNNETFVEECGIA
jgi:hypothetical protein